MRWFQKYVHDEGHHEWMKLVVPVKSAKRVTARLMREGWHIDFSGPYTDRHMFPKVDQSRHTITAQREYIPDTPQDR